MGLLLPDLRAQVLRTAIEMAASGLVRGTSGNVSARDASTGFIAITPSGLPYAGLEPADVVVVSPSGDVVEGRHKASSETPMHTAVYRARADVAAIVHAHSPFATAFSVMNRDLPEITVPLALLGRVPVLPFRLPGSEELAEVVAAAVEQGGSCFLLRNHGVLCCCLNLSKALEAAGYVEEGAQVASYVLAARGELAAIPEDLVRRMREAAKEGKTL
jgi:L-fuculose-phosphate aldolase